MTDYEKGYLDGLNAAALCCEYSNGVDSKKVSRMAERIRAVAQKMMLKLERKNGEIDKTKEIRQNGKN